MVNIHIPILVYAEASGSQSVTIRHIRPSSAKLPAIINWAANISVSRFPIFLISTPQYVQGVYVAGNWNAAGGGPRLSLHNQHYVMRNPMRPGRITTIIIFGQSLARNGCLLRFWSLNFQLCFCENRVYGG